MIMTLVKCYSNVNSKHILGIPLKTRIIINKFSTALLYKMGDNGPVIFKNVEDVLDVFSQKEHQELSQVNELLEIYDKAKQEASKVPSDTQHEHKLIILEGLDGSGKSTVGFRLAKKLSAEIWRTPPESIGHLRKFFDENPVLRTAYYSLGNYIASLEVSCILPRKSVVMDRYWHSTCAYAIAQAIFDKPLDYKMPEKSDDIYSWPNDLIKPDIVLYLHVSEKVRLQRLSRRKIETDQENLLKNNGEFRKNIREIYNNMKTPGISLIDGDPGFADVLRQIEYKMKNCTKIPPTS